VTTAAAALRRASDEAKAALGASTAPKATFAPCRRVWRAARTRLAFGGAVGLLAVSNVVSNRVWPEGYLVWNLAMAGVLLLVARSAGLTWHDLGLGTRRLRRGLVLGAAAAAAVALVYAAVVALPATRAALADGRAAVPLAAVLFVALVRIPLGTVVLEELAFRGVLPALVGGGWWRATLVSSGLFGLWHVLPSMGSANAVSTTLGTTGAVVGTVLFTTAAGVAFRAWQRWSGHLVTPMLLHVATNSLGALVTWWVVNRPHP
jgi:uncharacterized protein